ncbi:MAG: hypothetical protein ACYDDO_14040 [Acidiferrobacterales bacterium]
MQNKSLRQRLRMIFAVLALQGLAACGSQPPSPPLVLPQLQRPLVKLQPAKSAEAQVLIPRDAFLLRGGLPGVFVLQNGRARFRMIKAGRTQGDRLEVLSGLSGDETLVVGNLADVHDGTPIAVK